MLCYRECLFLGSKRVSRVPHARQTPISNNGIARRGVPLSLCAMRRLVILLLGALGAVTGQGQNQQESVKESWRVETSAMRPDLPWRVTVSLDHPDPSVNGQVGVLSVTLQALLPTTETSPQIR